MFTQRCRDAITVTCTTRQFNHFTSEHYKVSKSVVKAWYLRKLYLQPIFESLLMTCAKNCFKKLVDIYVKPIASQTWDIFFETQCTYTTDSILYASVCQAATRLLCVVFGLVYS